MKDGNEVAGTITTFADPTLTIQGMGEGAGSVTGAVTDATEIKCESEDEHEDGAPDNSGPGSDSEHDGDADNRCSKADLAAGTLVHEAELKMTDAGPVFTEIELVK